MATFHVREAGAANQAETGTDLVLQDFEHARNTIAAGRSKAVKIETADRDGVGAERDRFDDIGAAIEAAIDDDLRPAATASTTSGRMSSVPRT